MNARRFLDVRTIFQRTSDLVSSQAFGRLRARTDEIDETDDPSLSPKSAGSSAGSLLVDLRARIALLQRRPWLDRALARQLVAASIEGVRLQALSYCNQRVDGWASVPVDESFFRGGQIVDPVGLGGAIDEAFDQLNLSRRRVIWSLPAHQATFKVVDLPQLQGEELRQAVHDEAERSLGVSPDDSYIFWQRLTGRIKRRRVFILAVPKTVVLTTLEALDAANIRPLAMDLRPLAIARAVGRTDAIIVNLEETSLDVIIVVDNVPVLMRSLPLSGTAIGRETAQNRLVEETERLLTYYDDANPDRPLDADAPIFLTGSWSGGISLSERIRAATRHPIGRLSPGVAHPPDFPVIEYLVNLGLALKQT
ncbi:MAG TPA: pilus assembly protein PilM [Chloroflexota bacterium]|nr:pilus assembly protein PilM [Chloroflexota bacterium]